MTARTGAGGALQSHRGFSMALHSLANLATGSGHWMGHFCNATDGKHPLSRTSAAYALQHSLSPCEHPKHCTLPTLWLHYSGGDLSSSLSLVFPSQPSLKSHPILEVNQQRTTQPVDSTRRRAHEAAAPAAYLSGDAISWVLVWQQQTVMDGTGQEVSSSADPARGR